VELDPDLDFAHWALGAACLAAGDNGTALDCFDHALALNPNNSDALANCAWPLMFEGRTEEAVDRLERAMRLNPFYPDWYLWGLGMAQYLRGNCRDACSALGRMSCPNDQSKAFEIAALMHLGEADRAREEVAALHRLVPGATVRDLVAPLGFRDQATRDGLADSLRAAGVSD
jgi:tetratricopeptide (TPR) repeat protein